VLLIIIFKINNFQYYPSSYEGIFLVIIDTQKWKRDYLVKVKIVQSENNLFVGNNTVIYGSWGIRQKFPKFVHYVTNLTLTLCFGKNACLIESMYFFKIGKLFTCNKLMKWTLKSDFMREEGAHVMMWIWLWREKTLTV
jgi:hypothetical protein